MLGWPEAWTEKAGQGDRVGIEATPGLVGLWQLRELAHSSGVVFDRLFVVRMLQHHAIDVARAERAEGEHEGAVALAASIEGSQTAEVTELRGMLAGQQG